MKICLIFFSIAIAVFTSCNSKRQLQQTLPHEYVKVEFPLKAVAYLNKADIDDFTDYVSTIQPSYDIHMIRGYLRTHDSLIINRRNEKWLVNSDSSIGATIYNAWAHWAVINGRIALKDSSGNFVKALERRQFKSESDQEVIDKHDNYYYEGIYLFRHIDL